MMPEAQFGKERTKIQPKLRMVSNGDTIVGVLRAEHSSCMCVRSKKLAREIPVCRGPGARPPKIRKAPQPKKLKKFSGDIAANLFITLKSDDTKETIKGRTLRNRDLVTANVSLDQIKALAQRPGVVSVELGDPLTFPDPIRGSASSMLSSSNRRIEKLKNKHKDGEGVLIGIIDVQGFDFAHPDFLDASGKTRFIRIWDQGGDARPKPSTRPPFDYGAEFEKKDLDAAIAAAATIGVPAQEIEKQSQMAVSSHGTHVASIAAGNFGICRKAHIAGVLISLPQDDLERRLSLYDSTRIVHAVEYLLDLAVKENIPTVSINISLGTNGHAHDGSSAAGRWIDSLLATPGRSISVAAGNAGQEAPAEPGDWGYVMGRIHTSGKVPAEGIDSEIEWVVVGNSLVDISENELEIWYSARDTLAVSVKPPNEPWIGPVELGQFIENQQLPDGSLISIYNERYHASNGDNNIAIYLSPLLSERVVGVKSGTWIIRLHGREIRNGVYHGWIERDDPRPIGTVGSSEFWFFPSFFSKWSNVDSHSISSLGCGERIISVANLQSSPQCVNISSSQGPTRDGRMKPEVAAPGTDIVAASGFDDDNSWIEMTGTSMASPYVCGVAGLMLAINPELTAAQICGIIRRTSKPLAGTAWRNDAGFGVIDPARCVEEADKTLTVEDVTK
jgi:subtilisin family serine protease